MMELLAGPFTVQHPLDVMNIGLPYYPEAPGAENFVNVYQDAYMGGDACWDDDVGICAKGSTYGVTYGTLPPDPVTFVQESLNHLGHNYYVIQMDGTAGPRGELSNYPNGFVVDARSPGGLCVFSRDPVGTTSDITYDLYEFEPPLGTLGALIQSSAYAHTDAHVLCSDRFLRIDARGIYALPLLTAGETLECPFGIGDGGGLFYGASVSRTADRDVLCIVWDSGRVIYYNVIAKALVRTEHERWIGANTRAWYSPRFDVFVSSVQENYIRIYANAVRPASISAPVASTSVVLGRMTSVAVQVLGAQGEPCAGELVQWSVVGPGHLELFQSATDADGTATNRYAPPVTLSTDPVVTAEVLF